MLYLGIVIGIFGIGFFLILIENHKAQLGNEGWTTKEIFNFVQPIALLLFLETLSLFFLRQYRIIFKEYKIFYSVYLRLFNYFHLLELETKDPEADKTQLRSQLIAETYNLTGDIKDDMSEPVFQDIVKKLIDKMK